MPCVNAQASCISVHTSHSVALKPAVLLCVGCGLQLDIDMNKKVSNHEMKRFR